MIFQIGASVTMLYKIANFYFLKIVYFLQYYKNCFFLQILEQPWVSNETEHLESVENIHITNDLKFKIFEDLWNKGFYITDGSKFGGDFLAYPGMNYS